MGTAWRTRAASASPAWDIDGAFPFDDDASVPDCNGCITQPEITTDTTNIHFSGNTNGTSWQGDVIEWARRRLTENQDAKADQDVPGWQCSPDVPVVAPVFLATLADMMALVEQDGLETDLFVTSCRDFADVRKWEDTEKVRWEDKRVWVFGVEVVRSKGIPVGHFCAVSRSEKIAVATICR